MQEKKYKDETTFVKVKYIKGTNESDVLKETIILKRIVDLNYLIEFSEFKIFLKKGSNKIEKIGENNESLGQLIVKVVDQSKTEKFKNNYEIYIKSNEGTDLSKAITDSFELIGRFKSAKNNVNIILEILGMKINLTSSLDLKLVLKYYKQQLENSSGITKKK